MSIASVQQDSNAFLDYVIDWSTWLGTDTITASTFTGTTGITLSYPDNTTTTATIWASGGTVGSSYNIVNRITTAGGRTDERSFDLTIISR